MTDADTSAPNAVTMSYDTAFARLAEIDATYDALHDERQRLFSAMHADGRMRATRALKAAGFGFGESIIAYRGRSYPIGVLLKVRVQSAPFQPGRSWHFEVWYRSVLRSGRMGRKLDYVGISVALPENLPDTLAIVGETTRAESLQHPRIIQLSDRKRTQGNRR